MTFNPTIQFYRIVDTEMLDTGVNGYAFYVLPESLTGFLKMMEKYKDIHFLGEPELVDIEIHPEKGPIPIEGEQNFPIFMGPGDGRP